MTTATPHPSGTQPARLEVVLRLLDHQIVGPEGELLGNVDDVEVLGTDAGWWVTGLAVGPGALAQRLPGRGGDWLYAIWRRLRPDADPKPIVVPVEHIVRISSAVEVDAYAARAVAGALGLELWLRTYVISRIPGARGGGDGRAGDEPESKSAAPEGGQAPSSGDETVGDSWHPRPGARFVSGLIGRPVVDGDGKQVGQVCELYCEASPPDGPQSPMRVTHLQYARYKRGSELGYGSDPKQGPRIVALLLSRWHRHNRVVPLTSVDGLSDPEGTLTVRDVSNLPHPHAFRAG